MKSWLVWLLTHALLLIAVTANAEVKREGAWPQADTKVTLDLSGAPRGLAVRKLAEAAGWSLVVQTPFGADAGDLIDVHVKDQPATKVLDLVLPEDGWIAKRDGTLVSLRRDASAAVAIPGHAGHHNVPPMPPIPPIPPVPPVPGASPPDPPEPPEAPEAPEADDDSDMKTPHPPPPPGKPGKHGKHGDRGEDRVITGGNLVIEKGEIAHDITVFGGNLEVLGKVTGDISVTGGNVIVRPGASVHGDVSTVGGNLTVEDGAEVEGDVGVVGGVLHRGKTAQIGGDITRTDGDSDDDHADAKAHVGKAHQILRDVGDAITRSAFLFIFGVILLALAGKRMETLRGEAATRPVRSFALGIVGLPAAILAVVALCITVIGIPVALLGIILAIFGSYAGVIAILTTAGEALLRHKTQNSYVHLGVGCAIFLLLSSLPVVGHIVTLVVVLSGIGVVVATRAAGFVPERKVPVGPYRTAA
jgi:hypothetical protein